MAENPLKSFIALVNFDQEIRELQKNIERITKEIEQHSVHIRKFQHEIEEKKQELLVVKKQLGDAELELKGTEMILEEKKGVLDRQGDYKTLQAGKKEIERLQNLQAEQETRVMDFFNRIDHLAKGFEKNSKDAAQEILTFEGHIQHKKKEIQEIETILVQKEHKRPELFSHMPPEWIIIYNDMREKVPDPVVPLSHESCSGCFSLLTAADIQEIKRNKLIPCKLCYRLIYLPDTE